MKKTYSFFKSVAIMAIILFCGNLFAQTDIPSIKRVPGDRKINNELSKQKSNLPPDPNSPTIIRNVPADYATIQAAINAASNGDIVLVASGIYRENLTLNKFLKLRGANYGINPNTGIRSAETIIQPGTSDPDPNSLTAVNILYIGSNGSSSIIDGFTFDGDNTTITSGVVINGADIDAVEAISAYDGLSNTTISNNIVKNLNYAGIDLYNYYNGGAATFDNIVTDNRFDNIIPTQWGMGIIIYNNCYTSITNNVMTRVRIGIQTGNFYSADLGSGHSITNNSIESYRLGIFHNLLYTNAATFIISNNVFTTVTGAPNNIGIELSSIGSAVGVTVTDNNITGARNGYNLWNCTSTNTVTITGGVLTNCNTGVFANNFDGYSSNADPSVYAMTGITMTNCDTAIWVRDNILNTNSATVALNINNTTNIVNGTGIGLLIEGGDASVTFSSGDPVDFNTSLSKYIRLITNGSNVPSANINAQEVKFGGTKGAGLTDAQLFAVEDKIDHKIDWNTLGFVSVKANNDYVTVNSFYTPNTSAPAIQRGIDAAASGYTINVAAGTYIENFAVNKNNLILRGPNYGINPNTGIRVSEAIIMPAVDDPEYGVVVTLEQSNFIMDGFLLNGDNPSLNSGYNVGSADVNTSEGICNGPALGPYLQINHIDIQNNIFNNFDYQAIYLEVAFNSNQSWNYIKNNRFNNMWEGIQTYALHADISYNTFTGVDRALSMHSVHAATDAGFLPQIAYNTVSITWKTGYSRNIGIWVNYRDGNAPALEVKNNTINCSDASLTGKNFFGFYALTLKDNRVVTFADNTITGAGNCSRGFYMTNCPSSNVTLSGGAFNNIRDNGIVMVNNDLTWGAGDSRLTVNNLSITMSPGAYAGILDSTDNNFLNNPTSSNTPAYRLGRKDAVEIDKSVTNKPLTAPGSTVSVLNISNSTVNGGLSGIKVKGTQASANIHDNPSTITGAVTGVDIDGGTAAIYRNNITANGTGVRVKNSGNLDSITENFITSNTAEGINIEATAGTLGMVTNNDLSGNTGYAIHYLKATPSLSASCNWYGSTLAATVASKISGNVSYLNFLTNGLDNDGGTNGFQIVPGSCNGLGPVKNITQVTSYPTIQLAVNAANNGDVIVIDPGTYNEQVLINKEVTIKNSGAKPVINFTGTPALVSGKLTVFEITVPNVTIDSLDFEVDLSKLGSAIIASAANINNLSIKNNDINPYKSGSLVSFGTRNAVNINYGAYRISSANPSNIFAEKNNISYNFYGTPSDPSDDAGFRAGFATDEGGGTFTLNTIQTISQDIEARFGGAGDINVTNNNINGGGVNLAEYNAGAGNINVTGNIFDGTFANTYSSSLRLKNNQQIKTTLVSGNTFQNHNWGISLENYRAVTLNNNTFTPVSASTVFRHITVNTKLLASSSATVTQTAIDATFTNNTFNGSGTPGGTGLAFYNHDSDNDTYGTFTLGSSGNENNFNTGIATFIALDPSTGPSWPSAFPENNLGAGAITTMACWDQNLDIENNKFDVGSGLQLPSSMNFTNRNLLETALFHKPDNTCLGNLTFYFPVHNLTQNTYFMTIQSAINAANAADVIECAEYTYNERVTIDKSITLQGVNRTNCIINGSTFVTPGKGIQINNAVTGVTIKRFTVQNFIGTSGNADGGIYAIGGNNNLLIESVTIQNNVGGSGFYANGPVNTVTLDSVVSSGHTSNARGIVIWNGLKENITITNCEVFNNNCCGVELQDGQASGITFENNNIHDNADNGIGLMGIQGPGENLIKGNTLLNNGRFGIEIKNPNGSGLATGAGRIVVENNNVSRTVPIVDNRDIAGIAAFRRSVGAGNVDVPTGVVIQNNTVSGYVQPSLSEGFGIVVEGLSHTVSGNTVTGCDVGIQKQAGHLPYPGDGDQSNAADTYFGRGNSPQTCGIIMTGNTLSNTLNTRDVGAGTGIVKNFNTGKLFCTIQSAINDAQTLNGHIIEISDGTYNEQVLVNKSLVIKGTGAAKSIVDFTGTVSGKPTIFDVSVPNVSIENLRIRVDMTKLNSAIIASAVDIDNLSVKDDSIEAYGSSAALSFGSYGNRNAISINYFGSTNYRVAAGGVDNITVTGNTISGVLNDGFGQFRYFRSGVSLDEGGGVFNNNTIQTINHDLLVRFGSNGNIDIKNNYLNGGGIELADMNAGAGVLTISDNVFDATFANTSAPGTAVMRLKNNYFSKTTLANRNIFTNHQWAVSLENYNTVTLDSNIFTPLANSTVYHHLAINNKSITSNSNTIVQVTIGAILTRNTFNNSGTLGGTALSFHNHDNDAALFGTFNIGSSGYENYFNNGILNFVYLDSQTGLSSGSTFPPYSSVISGPGSITTMACWANDINIENNKFDVGSGLQFPSAMNFTQRTALETNLFHKPDNTCLGNLTFYLPVHNLTQNTYFMTIQSAINAANAADVIECAEYTYNERVTIDKSITLQGVNRTNCIINGSTFVTPGKGIQINNAVTGVTIKRFTVQNFIGTSGNADGGIYAIGGNNNLLIESVTIQNNVGGSGFYANGPVNTVTLDSVVSSGHTSNARGIVIWNGLKENITITNCEVFNNNCCGVELQDGQASGITFENNNIHDNADNGIGLMGIQGPGENLIKGNTLLNNGRFGIEIKNPNGSGLATGAGRIVVENNNVSRTVPIVDNRDIAGIAAFRRSVGAGNVDVPTGVVIQNNTVSGYVQPSLSEGFGIVVEGLSHTVSGNTVTGCDVGIQKQAGHLPYPGDGDQSNAADTYFGRGNSPQTCGIIMTGNTLSNTLNTRDVGVLAGGGIVMNTNTNKLFCSIQSAIDDAQTLDGHTISISAGTYTENITLNKRLTIDGAGSSDDPTVSTIIQSVAANTPDIQITSSGLDAGNRIIIKDLRITGATGSSNTGAGILVQSSVASGYYTFDNIVSRVNQGAGLAFNGTAGVTDVAVTNSVFSMNGNDGLRIATAVPSFTDLNVTGCQIDSNATSGFDYNPSGTVTNTGTNFNFTNTSFTRNSTANITNAHDVSFFRFYGNATLTNVNVTSNQLPNTSYGIAFTGKNTASGAIQLNGVTCNGIVGKGALIFQQYSDINNISLNNTDVQSTTAPWGQVIIDHTDIDALSLGNTVLRSLVLWNSGGVNATSANFRHITLGTPLSNAVLADNFQIEDQIVHKIDLLLLGLVRVKTGEVFVTVNSFVTPNTTPSIQRGIDAASAGNIVNAGPGNFTEQLEVNKPLTIDGQGSSITNIVSPNTLALSYTTSGVNKPVIYVHDAADVIIKDITVDGAGKGNANNRFQGIAYRNAGGTVRNSEIKAIRNTPADGAQAGVGIYAFADNGTSRTLNFIRNNIYDFQKNATVFAGADLTAKIDSNTITGSGPVNFIAQNGIQVSSGAAGSVRYNTISNLSYTPSSAVSCGVLLYQSSGPDTTSNNTLTACQMGIYYLDIGGVIRENTINATAINTGTISYWGIDADPGGSPRVMVQPFEGQLLEGKKKVNISNSPFSITTSIFRNTLSSDGTNGTGIEMDALGTETLNATALENKVNGWDVAILFYKDPGATLNGVANDNNLSGNTFALYNQSGVLQNGTCNWYGTIVPATILTKISGLVNSSPYLTNGTDFNAAPGFQPVPGSCNGIAAATMNIKLIQEGFYNISQKLNKKDTVRAYLRLNFSPYSILDSAKSTVDSVTFTGSFQFSQPSGTYYIVVKHRNTLETWSKSGGEVFTAGATMNYDFTDLSSKAFGNNMVQVDNSPVRQAIYSGDINQDGIIEAFDASETDNAAFNSLSGYVRTDVTGDDFVDASDLSIVDNNVSNGVTEVAP
jgi:hypothetical protein